MSDTPESQLGFTPITWRKAGLLALIAVGCFHTAYSPARSGVLAFAIVGYVICLVQLARLRTTRQCFYVALAVGFACFAPQLGFFWRIFGAASIALWLVLALWLALFVVLTHLAIVTLGLKRAAFLTPFFWTGLEYFRSELYYLKFSWLNVGYALAESTIVPWMNAGVYGMGFVVTILASIALIVRRKHFRRPNLTELVVIILIVSLLASICITAMMRMRARPNCITAGVQLEFPSPDAILTALDKTLIGYQALLRTNYLFQNHSNLDLIVLPEYTLDGEPTDALKEWCRTNQKFLIVGGKQPLGDTNYYNTAFVISTNGEVVFKQVRACRSSSSRMACLRRSRKSGTRRGARLVSASVTT